MKLFQSLLLSVLFVSAIIFTGCNEEPVAPVTPGNTHLSKLTLPAGAVITSATLNIYVQSATTNDATVHNVNVPWTEAETWNTFFANPPAQFNPTSLGGFTGTAGLHTVDITALVQAWVDGITPNFGVLLDQALVGDGYTIFRSSEWSGDNQPFLEVTYTVNGGAPVVVRETAFIDTFIWSLYPDDSYGNDQYLYLANVTVDYRKYVLVKFDIEQAPQETECGTGYAYGGNLATPFCGLTGAGSNNWGWTNYIATNTNYSLDWPIYVGAAQCDLTKGTLVGTFHLNYTAATDQLVLSYDLNAGYTAETVHIWIGNDKLPKKQNGSWNFAPGQFNYNGQTFPLTITRASNFWIAAHFGICWEE